MLSLLPAPRQVHILEGTVPGKIIDRIWLEKGGRESLQRVAGIFQARMMGRFERDVRAEASSPGGIHLRVEPVAVPHEQGYSLEIKGDGVHIKGHDEAGLFYGLSTLFQIIEQAGEHLPCLWIMDWPDFPARGVMLDISRDKVPTMETLYGLVDLLSSWKINQLQLYMEHTFAYQNHPEVWANSSPLTGEEIRDLDSACQDRFIELVPNQNSFGHMNRWLAYARYAHLAEVKEGFEAPWGKEKGPFSLCPLDPESLLFIFSLYDELLPHFSSQKLNVGCDETLDLGQGRSKDQCKAKGRGRLYLDFLLEVYAGVKQRGRTMMYWADMVQEHPELVPYLPKDAIALEWGYEADHAYAEHCRLLQSQRIPYYVCPGTSAWSSIAGRSDNALQNLRYAAENGIKYGSIGYLITDWGDNGHWQPLPVSYLGFAAGAAYAWSMDSNREIEITRALDLHAFHDRAGIMGKLAYELGNIYQSTGIEWANASVLSAILQRSLEKLGTHPKVRKVPFDKVLAAIDTAMRTLERADIQPAPRPGHRPDLYLREFKLASRLLRHACLRGILAVESYDGFVINRNGDSPPDRDNLRADLFQDLQEIIEEYEQVWLARNRPGGLRDSTARLKLLFQDYQ